MIKIRAKTIIKLATKTMNIDLEFDKGSSINGIVIQMLGYMVDNHGIEKVRTAINKKLDEWVAKENTND